MAEPVKKNGFKYWIGRLHLWLGLSTGAIVCFLGITGALYVFENDITRFMRRDAVFHGEQNIADKEVLPLTVLEHKVNAFTQEPYPVHWVSIPVDKSHSYIFNYYERDTTAWNYFDELVIYKSVYVNPFTGAVLGMYDEEMDFFNIVKMLHFSFLLKADWGTYLTGIPTLIFVFMLISGIILWWPRNKSARTQRFRFRWKDSTQWKRKNYDLHNILGFYVSSLALVVAITGLFYAFVAVQAMVYFVFSGGSTEYPNFDHITTKAPMEQRDAQTLDRIGAKVEELYPDAYMYFLDLGHAHLDDHAHPNYSVYVQQLDYSYHIGHSLIFDENSGELLNVHDHQDKNFGEKVVAANYDIHVGAILGLPTKILALVISLVCASLPVTGFMVWWGRKRRTAKGQVGER